MIAKLTGCILFLMSLPLLAQSTGSIKIHALHEESFSCTEHWDGQFQSVGDALGTDCIIQELIEKQGRLFQRAFLNDGFKNEDWLGFDKNVLAPCDCVIESIHINTVMNEPGVMTPGRATSITLRTENNKRIVLAHLKGISVSKEQNVIAGEVIAKVGNNGYSRNPHVHIAAWDKDKNPLQIQFNQKTIGKKIKAVLKNKK